MPVFNDNNLSNILLILINYREEGRGMRREQLAMRREQ
jgi:hypothetical protein